MKYLILILITFTSFNSFASINNDVLTIKRVYEWKQIDHQLTGRWSGVSNGYRCTIGLKDKDICVEFTATSLLESDNIVIKNDDRGLFNNIKREITDPKERIIVEQKLNQFLLNSYEQIENDMKELKGRFK